MARPAVRVADSVASRARGLIQYTKRVEKGYRAGALSSADVGRCYGGALLFFYPAVDQALERIFCGLLSGTLSVTGASISVRPHIVRPSSWAGSRRIVLGDRDFLDWLPYRLTLDRAGQFFQSGDPFRGLGSSDRQALERLLVIRNVLAHESVYARRRFEARCLTGATPADQRRPAGYLRGQVTATQTRFELLLIEVTRALRTLCT